MTDSLTLTVVKADHGKLGLDLCVTHSDTPHGPEDIAHLRNVLSNFLIDNGYEGGKNGK